MNDFDLYFKMMKNSSNEDDFMAVLSTLPCLNMLLKLMDRKAKAKKPFSSEFNYQEKLTQLLKAEEILHLALDKNEFRNDEVINNLNLISNIAIQASEEIKLISLKNDYLYLASIFKDSAIFLS